MPESKEAFTEEQLRQYRDNPCRCPFCGVENLRTGLVEFGDQQIWVNVICRNCKKEWQDVYELVGVEDVNADRLYRFPED